VTRVAAVGDIHVGEDAVGCVAAGLAGVSERADLLLLAGDLTRTGTVAEAALMASELAGVGIPIVAVLGNHDVHSDRTTEVTAVLERAGIVVLDGTSATVATGAASVGVAGTKGFGGGFVGGCAAAFGERVMRAFVEETEREAARLHDALVGLKTQCDRRVALLHYSPVADTLAGEPLEIYPFLGSYLLADAIDAAGADLVVHGHAHRGAAHGRTPGGIPVHNVAQPVIRDAYRVFDLADPADLAEVADPADLAEVTPGRAPSPSCGTGRSGR
jgi:Icc-related predicted phosphoesterase